MTAEPKVFISYRRQDTSGHAGRLFDAMASRVGEQNIFMDVDLAPGVHFVERIKQAIGACRVLLVMIGPRWTTLANETGEPRLTDPEDFVRLEVETALLRDDVTVIPVLVGGAQMPDPDDLPEGIRPLAYRNAIELSDLRWRYDISRLNATMDQLLAEATGIHETAPPEAPPAPSTRVSPNMRLVTEGILVAGLAALIGRLINDPIRLTDEFGEATQAIVTVAKRTITWATVGAALAVWLTFVRGETRRILLRGLAGLALGALAGALGGLVIVVPEEIPDPNLDRDTVRAISIGGFAVSAAIIGGMLGALWTPRNLLVGIASGLVAGAAVRVFWNSIDTSEENAFEAGMQIGIQMLLIVGLILTALRFLAEEKHRPALPAVNERHA